MSKKVECREVRKVIFGVSDRDCGRMLGIVTEHLSECEECRSLHESSQKLERILFKEKVRLAELAEHGRAIKNRIFVETTRQPLRRPVSARRLVWAGAAAVVVVAIAAWTVVYLLGGGGRESQDRFRLPGPAVTHEGAAAASRETLGELAAAVSRHETRSAELPYTAPVIPRESFVPGLLQRTAVDSRDTLSMILDSKTKLTRREET